MEYDTFQKTDQAKDNFYILQLDLNNLYGYLHAYLPITRGEFSII